MQALGPNQEAWLTTLETTNKRQTKERLHRYKGGYCCLGIACETLNIKGVLNNEDKLWKYGAEKEGFLAPEEVIKALGLRDEYGSFDVSSFAPFTPDNDNCLTGWNDSGVTFKQIAANIRSCPEAFFTGVY